MDQLPITNSFSFRPAPQRIVSAVPSLSEAVCFIGAADRLVGRTDWCTEPRAILERLPSVGGTKKLAIETILSLRPDLLLANKEENRRQDIEQLNNLGIPVWVSNPNTVVESLDVFTSLLTLNENCRAGRAIIEEVRNVLNSQRSATPIPVFCPIWREPWMSPGPDTYIHSLLAVAGGTNIFAEQRRRRYPNVSIEEVVSRDPAVVLLPSEPYQFTEEDRRMFLSLPIQAARTRQIYLVDGSLLTWHSGPRMAPALSTLRGLFSQLRGERLPKAI